ncbi:MAG: hypothetical protein ACRDBO_15615 [Lachnospiraceae bacterium]
MKKKRAAWLAVALGLMLTGCGQQAKSGEWNSDTGSIYVNQAMEIQSSVVFTSQQDNDTYNQDELKAYAEEVVISYNSEHGGAAAAQNSEGAEKLPVALKSATLNGKTGKLIFEYKDGESLAGFAAETGDSALTVFSVMKVSDTLAAGGLADGTFVNKEGVAVSGEEVAKQSDYKAVTAEGAAIICTEGEIVYVTEGVTLRDSHTAETPEGKNYIIFQ